MTPAVVLNEEAVRHVGCLLGAPVIRMGLALGLHIGNLSCVCGESATTSACTSDVFDPDSSSVDTERGMDRKLRVLPWGLPLRQLKAVSLYIMGSLGLNAYDAVEQVLSGELGLLLDFVGESHYDAGLSATTS